VAETARVFGLHEVRDQQEFGGKACLVKDFCDVKIDGSGRAIEPRCDFFVRLAAKYVFQNLPFPRSEYLDRRFGTQAHSDSLSTIVHFNPPEDSASGPPFQSTPQSCGRDADNARDIVTRRW